MVSIIKKEIDGWNLSPRGAGYLFGGELVMEGYRVMFQE